MCSDIVFEGVSYCVLQGKKDKIGASKRLFDNFNS